MFFSYYIRPPTGKKTFYFGAVLFVFYWTYNLERRTSCPFLT